MTNSTKFEIGDIVNHKAQIDKHLKMVVVSVNEETNQITCEFQHPNGCEFVKTVSLSTSLVKE